MKRWDKGSELRITERLSLRVFLFFSFFLPPYIPHLSMHLENSQRLSVLWMIRNFSMISAEKVSGSFDSVITVEWISPVMHRVQKRLPKLQLTGNASVPKFEKLQSSFTTDLYDHESCVIKLALEKLNRRQQLLDREANSKVIC